ncbi:hypothetical protein AGMMS49957_11510 [Synergistales bacterium]|nr:hypothetical protein AGMMS49957_11510 [Synergistales bacterium]
MSIYEDIQERLTTISKHPLAVYQKNCYYSDFLRLIDVIISEKITKKMRAQIFNKLLLSSNKPFDLSKYLQGVSEIVICHYFNTQNYVTELEKKVNLFSNNKDVDLSVLYNNIWFNFEVKCPELQTVENSDLIINQGFRTADKDAFRTKVTPVIESIANANGCFSNFQTAKINDNKVCDYLKSCQEKFDYGSSINILVLSIPISEFTDYWNYLCNPWSGILYPDASQRIIAPKELDKTDVVWITTFVDKHIVIKENHNAWSISDALNILNLNPFSKKISEDDSDSEKGLKALLDIIPNETERFDVYVAEYYDKLKNGELNKDSYGLMIPTYLDEYHKETYNP